MSPDCKKSSNPGFWLLRAVLYCASPLKLNTVEMTYVNGGSVIAIGVIFPVLGTVSVALRFAVRRTRKAGLGTDDWLIMLGLVKSPSLTIPVFSPADVRSI